MTTKAIKPKLIAFDLDGTLAESKQRLPAEMGNLLSQLLEKMPVAIMSGASFAQFEKQVLPALPETPFLDKLFIFPTNAAQCYVFKQGRWQSAYDQSFNTFEKNRIMQAMKEALEETGFTEPEGKIWGERIEDRGAQISFSGLGQQAPLEAKRAWDPTGEKKKKIREALARRLPDFSVVASGSTTVDVTKKGIDKAYGIRKLIELAEVSVGEMVYVGDALEEGGNDSVVKNTGIHTIDVFGPEETALIIQGLLR
jgi:HAD superfamily hydrolase (TIGR01484 family)